LIAVAAVPPSTILARHRPLDCIDTIFAEKPDPQKWIRRAISGASIITAFFEELR